MTMVMHYGISPGHGAVRDSAGDAGPMGWSWKLGIAACKSFSRCQWRQVIIGAGLRSRPLLFPQNDLFFKSLGPLMQTESRHCLFTRHGMDFNPQRKRLH